MVPIRGIEPRVHPYHGRVLPLYYIGIGLCVLLDYYKIFPCLLQQTNHLSIKALYLTHKSEIVITLSLIILDRFGALHNRKIIL